MSFYSPSDIRIIDATSVLLFHRQYDIPANNYFMAKTHLKKAYYLDTGIKKVLLDDLIDYYIAKYPEELLTTMLTHLVANPRWTQKEFVLNNLDLLGRSNNYVSEISKEYIYDQDAKIPGLSYQELIEFLTDILQYVDPTGEWNLAFSNALKDNKIIDKKKLSDDEKKFYQKFSQSNFNILYRGEQTVILDLQNNLTDLFVLIHEFVHYLANLKRMRTCPFVILNEFPSCFYELITRDYLLSLGYRVNEINKTMSYRHTVFIEYELIMNKYLELLKMFKSKGIITYNILEEYNMGLKDSGITENFIKECINNMSYKEFTYIDELPYIYGYALAEVLAKEYKQNSKVLKHMKNTTDNLYKINPEQHYQELNQYIIKSRILKK